MKLQWSGARKLSLDRFQQPMVMRQFEQIPWKSLVVHSTKTGLEPTTSPIVGSLD